MKTNKHKHKIAVFGSLTIDLFVQPSQTQIITQITETSSESFFSLPHGGKISAEHIQEHFGGGASNVGVSFSKLENQVYCVGGIGNDINGEKIVNNLLEHKISRKYIQKFGNQTSPVKSGFSLILNAFDGERTVIFTSEANKKFEKIQENFLHSENFDALYLCHISGDNPENIFSEIQKFLKNNPEKKFFWNPGHERISLGLENKVNKNLLQNCDIIFLNTEEAEAFSCLSARKKISHAEEIKNKHTLSYNFYEQKNNESVPKYVLDVSHIANKFLDKGVKTVIITDGRKGAQAFSKNEKTQKLEYLFIPCVSSSRIDTLGAGDAFASTFAHFYMQGETIKRCGEYASINASSVVAHQGAQDGLLTKTQILQNII